jgi:hypothetical protein
MKRNKESVSCDTSPQVLIEENDPTEKGDRYKRIQQPSDANTLAISPKKAGGDPKYPGTRFYMLFLFSLVAMINQVGWIAFAPLSDIVQKVSTLA